MKKIWIIFAVLFFILGCYCSFWTLTAHAKEKKATKPNSKSVVELEKEVNRLKAELEVASKHCPVNAKPLKLTITAAVVGKQLHTTALGKKVQPGQCAVSQDLAYMVGKWLYIPGGIGKTKVACVMPNKWKGSIDYYTSSISQAKKIGRTIKPVAVL